MANESLDLFNYTGSVVFTHCSVLLSADSYTTGTELTETTSMTSSGHQTSTAPIKILTENRQTSHLQT